MKLLPYNHDMYIEPTDPITTPGEFSKSDRSHVVL